MNAVAQTEVLAFAEALYGAPLCSHCCWMMSDRERGEVCGHDSSMRRSSSLYRREIGYLCATERRDFGLAGECGSVGRNFEAR